MIGDFDVVLLNEEVTSPATEVASVCQFRVSLFFWDSFVLFSMTMIYDILEMINELSGALLMLNSLLVVEKMCRQASSQKSRNVREKNGKDGFKARVQLPRTESGTESGTEPRLRFRLRTQLAKSVEPDYCKSSHP